MFPFVEKNKERSPINLGRKRLRRARRNIAVVPAELNPPPQGREWIRARRWATAIFGFLLGCDLVRHRGPGLPPEERWEFENADAKEAFRNLRGF